MRGHQRFWSVERYTRDIGGVEFYVYRLDGRWCAHGTIELSGYGEDGIASIKPDLLMSAGDLSTFYDTHESAMQACEEAAEKIGDLRPILGFLRVAKWIGFALARSRGYLRNDATRAALAKPCEVEE